jgi:predicted transcriptional regulator
VVKTAVSIPDQLFADVESAARRLGVSRSKLYARALEQFLAQQEIDPVTARLDELADEFEPGSGVADGRRLIDQGLWQW